MYDSIQRNNEKVRIFFMYSLIKKLIVELEIKLIENTVVLTPFNFYLKHFFILSISFEIYN